MNHEQVTSYATETLKKHIGSDIPRCFLAGGAYKTLINGHPPRDLDIWAETKEARKSLITIFRERGKELSPGRGADRFIVDSQLVEVSFQIEPMEERLARFDLGISCIAVVFRNQHPVSFIHPLALESIQHQEILLIQLSHPALALATLVRARRYAQDLGYTISKTVEQRLWGIHDSLKEEGRLEQLEKLRYHYGTQTWGVMQEAEERLLSSQGGNDR
jgi:hypothetical protein